MQNIAKAGIGYAWPFPLLAAVFTLQIIEDAFHPQQLYSPFYAVSDQSSGFSRFKNLST
jgi:hypothetical protein